MTVADRFIRLLPRRPWLAATLALLAGLALAAALPQRARAQETVPAQPQAAPIPAASQTARDVLARVRPSVIQIRGFFGTNTAQAFHGTGFAVAAGGVFMTNYHVVSQHVMQPARYRLEYRTAEGMSGPLAVLAVDVRHDLALVRATGHAPPPLAFEKGPAAKGERAFAVGFPLDVGLTITEGVSNGRVEDSFEARIHYSGAINGGMSGGPALDAAGDVIGVNVSGYRFEQLVAFLVPGEHARKLRERVPATAPSTADLKSAVTAQLREHSGALLGALDGALATQVAAGYALPAKLGPFVNCNAGGDPQPEDPVLTVRITCSAKAGLFISPGLHTGDLQYSHFVLSTEKLDAWRFAARLSGLTQAVGARGSYREVAPYACQTSVIALKGFDASLLVCTRAYRKFEGLYDFTVRVSSLDGAARGFASHLDMHGLEFDAGMAFVRRYVEAMERQPALEGRAARGQSTEGRP